MIKLKDLIKEIGEANVKPFKWNKTAGMDAMQFKDQMSAGNSVKSNDNNWAVDTNTFEFTTDKGTAYIVDIDIESVYSPLNKQFKLEEIECEIDFSTNNNTKQGDLRYMAATNKHEQYAVMSTISDILIAWVNEWDEELYIDKIIVDPIKDEGDDSYGDRTDNKRGRLYHAFMKKQVPKFNKQYHVRVFDNHFEISPRFINPKDK